MALKIVREDPGCPATTRRFAKSSFGSLRQPPQRLRVHDLAASPYGPILVMGHITGQTLHSHIRRKKAQGGYTADEFRRIAHDVASSVAAIHQQGLVHGDLKPGNVMVTTNQDEGFGKAIVLDFGFAKERARASARLARGAPDGGTPGFT